MGCEIDGYAVLGSEFLTIHITDKGLRLVRGTSCKDEIMSPTGRRVVFTFVSVCRHPSHPGRSVVLCFSYCKSL